MPVKVKCSNCDKVLAAPDAARGKAIRCPECQTKIAVPAESSGSKSSSKPGSSKPKQKKAAGPLDSEAALASFDMRRAEDTEARICSKCGFDMKYQDEDDTECPQCGYDSAEGGLGTKARKRAMKGPDPADFYPGLFKDSWKFVGKNNFLAIRTIVYTLVSLSIALGCAFLYLWVSPWPPRWFLALCFTISFLVIPGWMWFLDTEVIKLTLERKDKFKKLNFDFFLSSAMGVAFVCWSIAVALPVIALPAGLGYYLVHYNGMAPIVLPITIAIGAIPAIWMLPVVMSHMSMPVQYKGWLIWNVVPLWAKNIKPLTVWLLFFIVTNTVNIAGIATIAALFGNDIGTIVQTMEFNADIARKKAAQVDNPNARKKGQAAPVIVQLEDPRAVNFKPLIVPAVILVVMSVVNGFTCMFNMRTNGQFTYYNKNSLDLIDRRKEYKYKAIEKRDEDEDEKPKTPAQMLVDAIVFVSVFDLIGLVGGMLYGSFSSDGVGIGIIRGLTISHDLAALSIGFQCLKAAFDDSMKWGFISLLPFGIFFWIFQNWEERKTYFIRLMVSFVVGIFITIAIVIVGISVLFGKVSAEAPQAPAVVDPAQMMQPGGMMQPPGGMMQPPGMAPQGAHGGAAPAQPPGQ